MKKIFRSTYYLGVVAIFLVVAVLGFTQTNTFRHYLRQLIIESVGYGINSELRLNRIEGNLLTGFWVDSVAVYESGSLVLFVERLEARYDPLSVFVKRISLSRVKLVRPAFILRRSSEGVWNTAGFSKPASPDTPPDSTSSPSSWVINIRQVEVQEGTVSILDSVAIQQQETGGTSPASDELNYADLSLESVTLDAGIRISDGALSGTIRSFSFASVAPGFRVQKISGDVFLSPTEASVRSLDIKTDRSFLRIDARVQKADMTALADLRELRDAPFSLSMKLNTLDLAELKQVVGPSLSFLDRSVRCDLEAEGTFRNLEVTSFHLQTSRSSVNLAGTITNLHAPEELELDFASLNSTIDARDLGEVLPGLRLPNLDSLGLVNYDLWLKGRPRLFAARLAFSSQAGSVGLETTIDSRGEELSYEGTVKAEGVNLAPLLHDNNFTSNLNATIDVKGSGTTVAAFQGTMTMQIDTSQFRGMRVRPSTLSVGASERTLRSKFVGALGQARFDLATNFVFLNNDSVSYHVLGTVGSLNLAELLRDARYQSDLSFEVRSSGVGLDPEGMRGTLDILFSNSSFKGESFDRSVLNVQLNTTDRERQTFRLRSDPADLDIDGTFTPNTFRAAIEQGATMFGEAVDRRFVSLDSLRSTIRRVRPQGTNQAGNRSLPHPTDAAFTLRVKDARPIGAILFKDLRGNLRLSGSITGTPSGINFGGEVLAESFHYADESTSLQIANSDLSFSVKGLSPELVFDDLVTTVEFRAQEFMLDSVLFSGLSTGIFWQGDSSTFQATALIDSFARVDMRGVSAFDSGSLAIRLEHLLVDIDSYAYENIDPVRLKLGADGFKIDNLWMRHEVEELYADGYFDPAGTSDLRVSLRNFLLNNMRNFSSRFDDGRGGSLFRGIVNAEAEFKGKFEQPKLSLTLNANGVRYRETVFGQITSRSSYENGMLQTDTQFRSRPEQATAPPDVLVAGSLPYQIAFRSARGDRPEGTMDLAVRTGGFQLQFLEPFISELKNMSGSMVCDMKLGGTISSPTYEGFMELKEAKFLFMPLNISYIVNGRFIPSGRRIALEGVTVANIPQDRPDGSLTVNGTFTLEGLKIREFDLLANGQLLVMKESSRGPGQNLFGDLFGATSSSGIQWRGAPERSFVTGTLFIRNANLTFPPTRELQEIPGNRITIRRISEAQERQERSVSDALQPEAIPLASANGVTDVSPAARADATAANPFIPNGRNGLAADSADQTDTSFLDYIVYDLIIETQGITQVRFVFNNLTSEELFADLKGRATFTKEGDQVRLVGEVDLGSRSYYNSIFKKLDATGKINFTGSPFNPELDVVAKYEGVYTRAGGDSTASAAINNELGIPEDTRKVIVSLVITGTREQPRVRTELAFETSDGRIVQATGDVEANALSYLVTGSFRNELTQSERGSLISTSILGGLTSSVLSGPLTEFLRRELGVIKSVDVIYYGGNFQESADVRVTAELGDAVVRLGGRILNDINNTNASIQLPMSALLGSERWRNLILEAERRVEGVETIEQRRESKGIRLLYRITF
ncbi:MAG: hypothetical protein WEE20_14655 [Bacteroidota bacterium]